MPTNDPFSNRNRGVIIVYFKIRNYIFLLFDVLNLNIFINDVNISV